MRCRPSSKTAYVIGGLHSCLRQVARFDCDVVYTGELLETYATVVR